VLFAVLAAFCAGTTAHADEGDAQTPGVTSTVALPPQAKGKPPSWSGRAFRQGVVAVANPYGAEAGALILEQGGNAIDAAVAIAYALNVVEPQSAGIGGGGFMMIHVAKTGETITIDSRETAPAGATRDMFFNVSSATRKGVAVGVPGMVRGTALALQRYGTRSLAQVMAPAIRLADEGFAATPRYSSVSCTDRALNSAETREFFCPNGVPPAVGSTVQNKDLAETFRLIATHGPDCFYVYMPDKGCDIARGIIAGQARPTIIVNGVAQPNKPGTMTYADLAGYTPAERAPIEGRYRGYTLKAMGPPSSGALTVLQILKMLEPLPLGDAGAGYGFGAVKTLNVMADAMRIAFADRGNWMADADFVPVPTRGLLHPTYIALRGGAIKPGVRLQPNPQPDDPRPYEVPYLAAAAPLPFALPESTENGTTHFSVVDKHGNVVSYTNTIESSHGIGTFSGYTRDDGSFRSHGFLLNNELTDFNTTPSFNVITGEIGYNDVYKGKRPRSSMTPTMLFGPDGKPFLAYGSPGGATIINSVVNVTINLIDHKMPLQQAIDAGRISVAGTGSGVTLETDRLPAGAGAALAALGYTVSNSDVGSVQAVLIDARTGKQYGAADDRREGTVIGLPR
jgi:gamma-glutamyltranspeptidase/glutathione hydrolase